MSPDDFHGKPFDEGTLTKLQIFELYAREWFPVFLSPSNHFHSAIHVFDFFAGPGTDCKKVLGSPLRLLRQLQEYRERQGWDKTHIQFHFYDENSDKIAELKKNIDNYGLDLPNVEFDIQPLRFDDAFRASASTLADPKAAKLVFIDQTGVAQVTPVPPGATGKAVCFALAGEQEPPTVAGVLYSHQETKKVPGVFS